MISAQNAINILMISALAAFFGSILLRFSLLHWFINAILGSVAGLAGAWVTHNLLATTNDAIIVVGIGASVILYLVFAKLATSKSGSRSRSTPEDSSHIREHTPSAGASNFHHQANVSDSNERRLISVFISYRRDDSADVTGRIYDKLSSHFGNNKVFKDVDSIPIGRDFRDAIAEAVSKATVVIAVIGKDWLGSSRGSEHPRIEDPNDFVRIEIASALEQEKPIIPVLVSNATMPPEAGLPDDIKPIIYRNGVQVRPDPDFRHDIERLIKGIEQA